MKKLILLGVLFLFFTFVFATVVNINTFSNGLSSENLTLFKDQDLTRFILVPVYSEVQNMQLSLEGFNKTQTQICFQETINISTLCGGVAGGGEDYFPSDRFGGFHWTTPTNMFDGDYDTFSQSQNPPTLRYIQFNWTIPPTAINLTWMVKDSNATRNFTVPSSCFNKSAGKIKFEVESNAGNMFFSCYTNPSGIRGVDTKIDLVPNSSTGNFFYEEAMFWVLNLTPLNVTLKTDDKLLYNSSSLIIDKINISLPTGIINEVLINNCNCTNCTLTDSICEMPINFKSETKSFLTYSNLSLNYTFGVDNCSNFQFPILNLTYKDQLTSAKISVDNSYDLDITAPFVQGLNGSFINQQDSKFCSAVNYTTVNYTIIGDVTLTKDLYGTQIYEYTAANSVLGSRLPVTQLDLFLARLENTSTMVFTWRTNTFENVDGTMEIYTCDGAGNRNLVASNAIISGEAHANIELLNTPYSYEVIFDGDRFTNLNTYTKCHIETQSTRLYILDVGEPTAPITGLYSIPCNISKTGNFSFIMNWGENPQSDSQITGCVNAFRQTVRGATNVFQQCSNTSGISATVADSGFTYIVKGKLFQNGFSIGCEDELTFETATEQSNTFGITGVLSIFFLIGGLILLFSNEKPKWYPIIGSLGLILAWILGILAFGWVGISSLVFFVIIIVIIGRHGKKQ